MLEAYVFESGPAPTERLRYLLHLPPVYQAEPVRRWPLIFFLHGAGERGDDLERLRIHGIPRIVGEQPDFPFITVAPQCPTSDRWPQYLETLKQLLDHVIRHYAVDADRVYGTGMSMGGAATWLLGSECPETFAALAPICGYGLPSYGFPQKVCALARVPVWAFHGAEDDVVPLSSSELLVDELRACGGDVRFTVYPGVRHDSWTQTYANPELYRWFLDHTRAPVKVGGAK